MNKGFLKSAGVFVLLSAAVLTASSCSEYNNIKFKDKNKSNERIYGEKGAPPLHSLKKYDPDPNAGQRVRKIKDILYPAQ